MHSGCTQLKMILAYALAARSNVVIINRPNIMSSRASTDVEVVRILASVYGCGNAWKTGDRKSVAQVEDWRWQPTLPYGMVMVRSVQWKECQAARAGLERVETRHVTIRVEAEGCISMRESRKTVKRTKCPIHWLTTVQSLKKMNAS